MKIHLAITLSLFCLSVQATAQRTKIAEQHRYPEWVYEQYGENPDPDVIGRLKHAWPPGVNIQPIQDEKFCVISFSQINIIGPEPFFNYKLFCDLNFAELPKTGTFFDTEGNRRINFNIAEPIAFSDLCERMNISKAEAENIRPAFSSNRRAPVMYAAPFAERLGFDHPTKYELEMLDWLHERLEGNEVYILKPVPPKPLKFKLPEQNTVLRQGTPQQAKLPGVNYDEARQVQVIQRASNLSEE